MIWSSDMDRLYIVIPAYNEEENIEQVIRDWHPVVERHSAEGTSRLVVIDDGSKDGTYKILQEYQKKYPLLEDRKSTRLNSSHVSTSYAVFCLKKKTQPTQLSE